MIAKRQMSLLWQKKKKKKKRKQTGKFPRTFEPQI